MGVASRAAEPKRIALEIVEPAERAGVVAEFPASVGVVFPEGELASADGGALLDDRGEPVPFEAEVSGWWPPEKRSVKWLLLHFRASTDRQYVFALGDRPRRPEGGRLATADAAGLTVATGPLRVRLAHGSGRLFEDVTLNGQACLAAPGPTPALVTDDGACTLSDWALTLEENSPARAVVKGSGFFLDAKKAKVARLDVWAHFLGGETFVRLEHTLTWMVKDAKLGVRSLSLGMSPRVEGPRRARVGMSDFTNESLDVPVGDARRLAAVQDAADHFAVTKDGKDVQAGKHLGGWLSLEDAEGRGVGLCLRHAWQMFSSGLAVEDGQIRADLWPAEAGRMGFECADIMPADFYNNKQEWSRYPWSKESGHFEHEYGKLAGFLHTAEGAARTHEITLHFFDAKSRRTTAQLNSLAQHPLAARQDPRSAMRVPFQGLELTAVDRGRYPDVERAIDQIGHMATARWSMTHDYGWWRFGMMRWGTPGGALYRWFDGTQYDQQLIPWLLWMRGGGREYFEEGRITAEYAGDVHTNHFNTRAARPPDTSWARRACRSRGTRTP